jgi:membrane-bound lytic murein transglycosylase B
MKENPSPQENTALLDRRTFLAGLLSMAVLMKTGNAEALENSYEKDIENTLKSDEALMAPLFQQKYALSPEAWKTVMHTARKDLLQSSDARKEYKAGGRPALQRYIWFRVELMAIGQSEFSASETGENPFYQQMIQELSKKGIKPGDVQKLLENERLKKTNLKPLYFYCRPHSAQKQHEENTIKTEDLFGLDISLFKFQYSKELKKAEDQFGVNQEIIIAILKIESKLGLRTLDFSAFEVLNAIVSRYFVDPIAPENTIKALEKRKEKIKSTAAKNLTALLQYSFKNNLDPFSIKSNLVGAIGLPQFMPMNIEAYGVDGDENGTLDLESMPDAIFSIAKYLKESGKWEKPYDLSQLTPEETQKIQKALLTYNKSSAYGTTVLELAQKIEID